MTSYALEVEDLWVEYDRVSAVKGVSFAIESGQHLTLLGPSGCGKSTILRSIAGLEQATRGTIRLYGETVFDAARKISIPTENRNLSMVFQSYAIWPHMTVFDNVAFGLRVRKIPEPEIRQRVHDALALVGLQEFADRPSPNLSGGQQQRVALARAFVFRPRLILFDEPLSNLDAKLRLQMRDDIKALQLRLGIASLFVTHDQEEALVMSDQLAVLRLGVLEQIGSPFDVYYRPENAFVADFVGGSNIVSFERCEFVGGHLRGWVNDRQFLDLCGPQDAQPVQSAAIKTVHITLSEHASSGRNVLPVTIISGSFAGDFLVYDVRWGDIAFRIRQNSIARFRSGQQVYATISPDLIMPLLK